MKPTIFLGIDPGLSGAVAVIEGGYADVRPIPTEGDEIDCRELSYLLSDMTNGDDAGVMVCIEKLNGMPGWGARNFKFGGSFYIPLTVCQLAGFSIERIQPTRWKKVILEGTAQDKASAVKWAKEAYPNVNLVPEGKKKPSHDWAEALALAEYGRRMYGGGT